MEVDANAQFFPGLQGSGPCDNGREMTGGGLLLRVLIYLADEGGTDEGLTVAEDEDLRGDLSRESKDSGCTS